MHQSLHGQYIMIRLRMVEVKTKYYWISLFYPLSPNRVGKDKYWRYTKHNHCQGLNLLFLKLKGKACGFKWTYFRFCRMQKILDMLCLFTLLYKYESQCKLNSSFQEKCKVRSLQSKSFVKMLPSLFVVAQCTLI